MYRNLSHAFFLLIFLACLTAKLGAQALPLFLVREQKAYDTFRKGLLFYHSQHYAASREFFYQALSIQPYFHLARRYLGDAYYYSGNWSEALEQWEFLHNSSNGNYPLVHQRSELLRFRLANVRKDTPYVFLRDYHAKTWSKNSFRLPVDLAIGRESDVYLLSMGSANVIHFTSSGRKLGAFSGPFYSSLSSPLGMAMSPENEIYIYDYKKDKVRVFSPRGGERFNFGETGLKAGQFNGPTGMVVTKKFIFVSDSGNHRIQKFDLSGKFLLEIGNNSDVENQHLLSHPTGLAVEQEKTLYVADQGNGNILKFDFHGNFLGHLYSQELKKPRGLHIYDQKLIIADEESGILFYDLSKKRWSRLNELRDSNGRLIRIIRPFSARMASDGVLYVADYGANRLLALVRQGTRTNNFNCKIQKIDTSAFPQIALFVSIKNRVGGVLSNLGRHNLSVFENDALVKPIKTNNMSPYNRRMSIAIVKENSPFFAQNYNRYLSQGMLPILKKLRISDQMYLLRAEQEPYFAYEGLGRRRLLHLMKLGNLSSQPGLGKASYAAITKLLKRSGPRALLLLVSGKYYPQAFEHNYNLFYISQYAQSHNIPIHIISYEGEQNPKLKEQNRRQYINLAQYTKGSYIHAFDDENSLAKLSEVITNTKDHRYIITYKTNLGIKFKGKYIDLRLRARHLGTSGLADAGYFVP